MSATSVLSAPRQADEGVRLFDFTVGWMTLNLSFFLAGEGSGYVTGMTMMVDGGKYMTP